MIHPVTRVDRHDPFNIGVVLVALILVALFVLLR